jgi:hypothetical protein
MSGPMRLFAGSYPEFYDRLLVPVLFAPYARIPAERLRSMTVGNVLEIAAGTGVVTRALVHTLPEAVNITATDLNPPMLDCARSHKGMGRVHWQQPMQWGDVFNAPPTPPASLSSRRPPYPCSPGSIRQIHSARNR